MALYPQFQEFFRKYQPPLLATWGKNDPFFLPAGAEAYKRDIPKAQVKFYDTGHFALETHCREIASEIVPFPRARGALSTAPPGIFSASLNSHDHELFPRTT